MRILWFSITPSLATERVTGQPVIGNGWTASLEGKLRAVDGVELGIVFPWATEKITAFEEGGTQYYAFPKFAQTKSVRFWSRHLGRIEPDAEVEYYLEIIEDFQPDVIHIFGTERNYGLLIPLVDVPVLIWIQGNITVYTHMWFCGVGKNEVLRHSSWKRMLMGNSHWHKYRDGTLIAKRERSILRHCKYVLGRTQWDRRIMRVLAPDAQYFHCDEVLRDEFYFYNWKPHEQRDRWVIMSTIQDNLYKGLENIFSAAHLLSQHKGLVVEWRIAGISAQHDLLRIVERQQGKSATALGINLLGRVPAEKLIHHVLDADVFVHPSHIDNSPNSVCEAMILGLPVVASNAGGIPDLLVNQKEGLLVQPGDPYALAGALLEVFENYGLAIEYGQRARERALTRHDPKRIVRQLMDVSKLVKEGARILPKN